MKDSNEWLGFLLDSEKVDRFRASGKGLNTLEFEEVLKMRATEPVEVRGQNNYKAKKDLYAILRTQPWWSSDVLFIHVLPYLYVKNKVDSRFHKQPDLKPLFEAARKHRVLVGV